MSRRSRDYWSAGNSRDAGISRGCQVLYNSSAFQRSTTAAECFEAPELLIIMINLSAILTK